MGACAGVAEPAAGPRTAESAPSPAGEFSWRSWSPEAFAEAKAQDRLIVIDVVASWCHWCHVMDEKTYSDSRLRSLLATDFVSLRVDADAFPDVAERYAAWGWPATIVLTPDAKEIKAWRGFVALDEFDQGLRQILADYRAGTLVPTGLGEVREAAAASELRDVWATVTQQLDRSYDPDKPGWGRAQMYPIGPVIEASLMRGSFASRAGFPLESGRAHVQRAHRVLAAVEALHDTVWGGIYQYSVGGVWNRPHFEKLSLLQAEMISTYATQASALAPGPRRRAALSNARRVFGYLDAHMRGVGGFGVSQDADLRDAKLPMVGADYYALEDEERRVAGEPRRDLNVYGDVNSALAASFARMARVDLDGPWRDEALTLADTILKTHSHPAGGLGHAPDPSADAPRFLGDQVHALWACVQLYELTGDRTWRDTARSLADVLLRDFAADEAGFLSRTLDASAVGVFATGRRPIELNALAARALLKLERQLSHIDSIGSIDSGANAASEPASDAGQSPLPYAAAARETLLALGSETYLQPEGRFVGQFVAASIEASLAPIWVTVVGTAETPRVEAMQTAAAGAAHAYPSAVVDRSPPGEYYPGAPEARVFICDSSRCSQPVTTADALEAAFASFAELPRPDSPT